jgi:hypothetical protein
VALLQHPADPENLFDNGVGDTFSSRCFDEQLRERSNGFFSGSGFLDGLFLA